MKNNKKEFDPIGKTSDELKSEIHRQIEEVEQTHREWIQDNDKIDQKFIDSGRQPIGSLKRHVGDSNP
jgi:cell division FtsZ-interacting protein ZapD